MKIIKLVSLLPALFLGAPSAPAHAGARVVDSKTFCKSSCEAKYPKWWQAVHRKWCNWRCLDKQKRQQEADRKRAEEAARKRAEKKAAEKAREKKDVWWTPGSLQGTAGKAKKGLWSSVKESVTKAARTVSDWAKSRSGTLRGGGGKYGQTPKAAPLRPAKARQGGLWSGLKRGLAGAKAKLRFQRPKGKPGFKRPKPKLRFKRAKAKLRFKRARPKLRFKRAKAKPRFKRARPKLRFKRARPKLRFKPLKKSLHR